MVKGKGKSAYSSLWIGNPSQSYAASPATVLRSPWNKAGWEPNRRDSYPWVALRHQYKSACSTVDWSPVPDFNTLSI